MGKAWAGPKEMRSLLVPTAKLKLDASNVRRHGERNMEAIKASLERFGQRRPIVTRKGRVVAGNGTLAAARLLKWAKIAAVDADDMTEQEAAAYGIIDNQTGELSTWDYTLLGKHLAKLTHDVATGFTDAEWQLYVAAGSETNDPLLEGPTFHATKDQSKTIERALDHVREHHQGMERKGACLAHICAEFLRDAKRR